jgi:RNA polymerase sigma-70 factor (ECF subfamily)
MLHIYFAMIDDPADISKFEKIYEHYETMMYRVIYAVLKNKEDTEDALQDTFMKVAKNIHKIEGVSCRKTEAFLVILSENTAKDFYRRNKKQRENVELWDDDDIDTLASLTALDVLSEIISAEGYQKIVSHIEGMSDTYKNAMRLRFIFGYSNAEVAELLEITLKNAEIRIVRGRAMLMETLRKEGYHAVR